MSKCNYYDRAVLFIVLLLSGGALVAAVQAPYAEQDRGNALQVDDHSVADIRDSIDHIDGPFVRRVNIVERSPHAAPEQQQAMCYLSKREINRDPDPLKHGVRAEITCAHATLRVIGVDEEASRLSVLDGEVDLLGAGREWVEGYRRDNPRHFFGSTQQYNMMQFKPAPRARVLLIEFQSNAFPESGVALLTGRLVLLVESEELRTLETTVAAIRNQETIRIAEQSSAYLTPRWLARGGPASWIFTLSSSMGAYERLLNTSDGVREDEFLGEIGFAIDDDVAGDTPLHIQVRLSEPLALSVHLPIPIP